MDVIEQVLELSRSLYQTSLTKKIKIQRTKGLVGSHRRVSSLERKTDIQILEQHKQSTHTLNATNFHTTLIYLLKFTTSLPHFHYNKTQLQNPT
jgi:hypothetical protein